MAPQAPRPFQFTTEVKLTRIRPESTDTICGLLRQLETVSDASIFHHTFQSLEAFHYLTEGFSNDFAQWVLAACNENPLAEQLAAVDLRDYVSLADLRASLIKLIGDYVQENPAACDRPGFEPFYFLETVSVEVPTGLVATTLPEFVEELQQVSLSSIHFHFLTSRLRLQLVSNDFSLWLGTELNLPELAEQIERIDIYTNTLEGVRRKMLELAEPWLDK